MNKFKTSICCLLFIPVLFFEVFAHMKIKAQNPISPPRDGQPFIKCLELENDRIDYIASDNNFTIISENDGNVRQINNSDYLQNWNIQLGSKTEAVPFMQATEILILSHTDNNREKKKYSGIRQIDSATGITNWIKTFDKSAQLSLIRNKDARKITLISDELEILLIDTGNGEVLQKSDLEGKLRTYTSDTNSIYLITTENKLFQIDIKDNFSVSEIKIKPKNISTVSSDGNSLFLGNSNGVLYELSNNSNSEKKLFRTGGEISFIKPYENDLLVVSNDNFLYFYSTDKEKVLWKKRLPGRVILEPLIYNNSIFTTTPVEPVIYIFDQSDGSLINRINLGENLIIKKITVNENGVDVLTSAGLVKFGVDCRN